LYGLYRNTLHFSDGLTQTVGAGGAAVDQLVVQEAVAGFVVGEGEDVVYGPGRSSACPEVELYVVFVLIEPGVEQEGLESHASTSKEKLVLVTDSASRRADDLLVYERVCDTAKRGCGKIRHGRKKLTSGAKARTHSNDLVARLKSGPQKLSESSFFRSL
jgi:hypothetical protein